MTTETKAEPAYRRSTTDWAAMSKAERVGEARKVLELFRDFAQARGDSESVEAVQQMLASEFPRYLAGNNAERGWMTRRGEI